MLPLAATHRPFIIHLAVELITHRLSRAARASNNTNTRTSIWSPPALRVAQEKSKLIDDLVQQNQRLTSELVEVSTGLGLGRRLTSRAAAGQARERIKMRETH